MNYLLKRKGVRLKKFFSLRKCTTVILICYVIALAFANASFAAARIVPGWSSSFYAIACENSNVEVPLRDAKFPPIGCRPLDNIPLQLESPEGYPIGVCFTDQQGMCGLSDMRNGEYVVRAIERNWPEGFVPRANPILYSHSSAIGDGIVFVPAEQLQPSPNGATLTIHYRECLAGYAGVDFYNDCHDNPPSTPCAIEAGGPPVRSVETDADGNGTIANLSAGEWLVRVNMTEPIIDASVFCAKTKAPGLEFENYETLSRDVMPSTKRISMVLASGDDIICDFHTIPAATQSDMVLISFHFRTCKEMVPPPEIFEACHGNGALSGFAVYDLTGGGSALSGFTNDGGDVTVQLPPGRYGVQSAPGDFVSKHYNYCSQDGVEDSGVEDFPHIGASEIWTCDIYIEPSINR